MTHPLQRSVAVLKGGREEMFGGKSVLNVDNRKLEIKRDAPQVRVVHVQIA